MLVWYTSASDMFLLALNLILISILVIITVYDMRHTIIPDEMSLSVGMVAVLLLGYTYTVHKDIYEVLWNVVAGLGAGGFFAGLWYISKGRWIGLGDAKLALPLGIIAGLGGVFSMVVLSFWIGALISLTLLGLIKILKRGKTGLHFLSLPLTIKSEIPFAPFLVASFLLVYFFQTDIFTITYALFFW
jgi:leader peptidase (prepilin peptidase)/N-methyltransferase